MRCDKAADNSEHIDPRKHSAHEKFIRTYVQNMWTNLSDKTWVGYWPHTEKNDSHGGVAGVDPDWETEYGGGHSPENYKHFPDVDRFPV